MKNFLIILLAFALPVFADGQCDQPTSLEANNITANTADLAWTPGGTELYWMMEWGLDGFVIGEGNFIDSLGDPEFILVDLEAETSYDYYVWSICETDTSEWSALEFITLPRNNFTCSADTMIVDGDTVDVYNSNAIPYGPEASCWGNHNDGDLWYTFELTEAGAVEIFTEAVSSNDSHIALYQVSGCDSLPEYTELYCSEDISQSNWMSHIITEELSAGTYYIQAGTWTNSFGVYKMWIELTEPIVIPPNNECTGATVSNVVVGGESVSVSGNGTNASDENNMGAVHVWEAFTIDTCADIMIDFCGSSPIPTIIFSSLFDECPIQNIYQSGELALDSCEDNNQAMLYTSLDAGTYYYPVVTDDNLGGFVDYTMNITAEYCAIDPQPDTCTTWLNGPYGDFNSEFGGAPSPDTSGACPIYTLDIFSVYASEIYDVDNFIIGEEYSVSICEGEGAGTWPAELAILDTAGNIIAWSQSCLITFTAPYSGTFLIGINEAGACGSSSDNTETNNGFLSISCGGVVPGIVERKDLNFSIYPNPSKGVINILHQATLARYELELISIEGKLMKKLSFTLESNEEKRIDLSEFSNGMYILKMTNLDDHSYSVKRLMIDN